MPPTMTCPQFLQSLLLVMSLQFQLKRKKTKKHRGKKMRQPLRKAAKMNRLSKLINE